MSLTKKDTLRRNRQRGLLTGKVDIQLESPNPVTQYREVYTKSLDMIGELNKYKNHYIELFGHVELLPKEPDISVIYNEIKSCPPEKEECSIIRLKKMKKIVEVYIKYINTIDYKYKGLVNNRENLKKKYPYLLSFEKVESLYSNNFILDPFQAKFDNDRENLIKTWAFFSELGKKTNNTIRKHTMEYSAPGLGIVTSSFVEFALGKTKEKKEEYLYRISEMYCSVPRTTALKHPRAGARLATRNWNHNSKAEPMKFTECSDGSMIPYSKDNTSATGAENCESKAGVELKKLSSTCNSNKKWEWTLI